MSDWTNVELEDPICDRVLGSHRNVRRLNRRPELRGKEKSEKYYHESANVNVRWIFNLRSPLWKRFLRRWKNIVRVWNIDDNVISFKLANMNIHMIFDEAHSEKDSKKYHRCLFIQNIRNCINVSLFHSNWRM